jgi:hypothetical protein
MGCCGPKCIVIFAILVGLVWSGALAKLGVLPLLTKLDPTYVQLILQELNFRLIGFIPSMTDNIDTAFNYDDVPNGALDGKIALVTGANSGLGYWTGNRFPDFRVDKPKPTIWQEKEPRLLWPAERRASAKPQQGGYEGTPPLQAQRERCWLDPLTLLLWLPSTPSPKSL